MDMLDLAFDSGSFDVVLDKGSMDALMVDQGDVWNPKQEVISRVEKAIGEVSFLIIKVLLILRYCYTLITSRRTLRPRLLSLPPPIPQV